MLIANISISKNQMLFREQASIKIKCYSANISIKNPNAFGVKHMQSSILSYSKFWLSHVLSNKIVQKLIWYNPSRRLQHTEISMWTTNATSKGNPLY